MAIKHLNSTDYANIYGIIDDNGKTIGTVTVTLAGRFAGTTIQSWSHYSRRELRAIWNAHKNEAK